MLKLINHSFFNHKGGEWGTWNLSRARFPEGGGGSMRGKGSRIKNTVVMIENVELRKLLAVRFLVFYVLT